MYAMNDFGRRQCRLCVIANLSAGYDVDVAAGGGPVKGQIGKDLAGGRMIGKEKPIDEDQFPHCGLRETALSAAAGDGDMSGLRTLRPTTKPSRSTVPCCFIAAPHGLKRRYFII
jgi:hypothetical protein